MSAHHCYYGMEYSEDRAKITEWAPLIVEGRDEDQPIAATRIITGSDVDYGALTHLLVAALSSQPGFDLRYNRQVVALDREAGGRWRVTIEDTYDGTRETVSAGSVFVGAGGASLDLLQKSGIPEEGATAASR
jgi:malate dehydrogenase (quinone)